MQQTCLQNLNKDALYVLSVSNIKVKDFYSKLIKVICSFIQNADGEEDIVSVQHTALLLYHEKKQQWYIVEVGYSGLERKIIEFTNEKNFYISKVGSITSQEKKYIFGKYHNKPLKNKWLIKFYSITSVLIGWPYPFLTAAASVELPVNFKIFGYVLNYTLDLIRDIQLFIWQSILKIKIIPYCTESALETINELNSYRKQSRSDLLMLSESFYTLLISQDNKYYEIYPQQLFDTLEQTQLVKEIENNNTTFDLC